MNVSSPTGTYAAGLAMWPPFCCGWCLPSLLPHRDGLLAGVAPDWVAGVRVGSERLHLHLEPGRVSGRHRERVLVGFVRRGDLGVGVAVPAGHHLAGAVEGAGLHGSGALVEARLEVQPAVVRRRQLAVAADLP